MSTSLLGIKVVVEPFEYLHTQFEKVKLLVQEARKKNEALVFDHTLLSRAEVSLDEANRSLDPAWRKIK